MSETCDVEGCGGRAVATLEVPVDGNDNGKRCRACLKFDLDL
jgi:hypothetical protein